MQSKAYLFSYHIIYLYTCLFVDCSGDSANAVPSTKKLRTRVTRIWGDRRGQPNRSAMVKPHPERTSFRIKVSLVPGKYAILRVCKIPNESLIDRFGCSLYLHVHHFPAHSVQITALFVFYWQRTQRAINLSLPDGPFVVDTTKTLMRWLFLKNRSCKQGRRLCQGEVRRHGSANPGSH